MNKNQNNIIKNILIILIHLSTILTFPKIKIIIIVLPHIFKEQNVSLSLINRLIRKWFLV